MHHALYKHNLTEECKVKIDKIISDVFQITSGRRYYCYGLKHHSLSASLGEVSRVLAIQKKKGKKGH